MIEYKLKQWDSCRASFPAPAPFAKGVGILDMHTTYTALHTSTPTYSPTHTLFPSFACMHRYASMGIVALDLLV